MQKSKEILEDLYSKKRLTTYEIAEIYDVDRRTINRWFEKFNITVKNNKRKFELIKATPFEKRQRELIVGTLLGDGCIAKHGKDYRLVCGQCEKQKDFLFWKKSELGNFVNKVNKRIDKRGNSTMFTFNTVTHNGLKKFYELFYENNKKVVRPEMANYLTPFGIAVWIMDDGSLNKNVNMRLATDGFSYDDNFVLQGIFKTYDINVKICEYMRRNKTYYYLSFNKRNSILLTQLISPYVIDSMKYKLVAPQRLNA